MNRFSCDDFMSLRLRLMLDAGWPLAYNKDSDHEALARALFHAAGDGTASTWKRGDWEALSEEEKNRYRVIVIKAVDAVLLSFLPDANYNS